MTGAASLVAECGTNILFQKCHTHFKKKPFWGTAKNWRLDPKVCADISWLPISKMVTLDNWFSSLDARAFQSGL